MEGFIQLDGALLIGIQHALNADWLTPVMKAVTAAGSGGYFWIACCLFMLCFRKTRRIGIICSLSLLLTFICCNLILKPAVGRVRPWVTFEAVKALMPPPGDASFPSGHSANSMGPAWALFLAAGGFGGSRRAELPCLGWHGEGADAVFMHRLGICAVILSILIGISRLYLGMHYPSDVLCGWLLGMICAVIVHIFVKKYEASRGNIIGAAKRQKS